MKCTIGIAVIVAAISTIGVLTAHAFTGQALARGAKVSMAEARQGQHG